MGVPGAVAGTRLLEAADAALVPAAFQARAAALQIVAIGVMLCIILLARPQGFFGPARRKAKPGGGDA